MTDDFSLTPAVPVPPPIAAGTRVHPLDRTDDDRRAMAAEAARIRTAWAKLAWLLCFLGLLLAVSYLVPHIAEQTQYAITRGKQRAEHDIAREHIGESLAGQMSRASQMVSQVVGPSVVHINTAGNERSVVPLSTRTRIPTEGQGSGVVMEASGFILTNNHVVRGATDIQVSLADGRKLKAEVIGRDGQTDLAVLKIDADKLVPATFGDSEEMEPGALVWAIGSPFGLERTITSGILSAKHRAGLAGTPKQDFLQTDVAINPGNSGGPLVDAGGKVIGINTAIVGDAYQGISFAIPSNVARDIYSRIKVGRGWLGVQLDPMDDDRAKQVGLPKTKGVCITQIFLHDGKSPASTAGMLSGDVLLKWNGTPVNSPGDLRDAVEKTAIGSKADAVIWRNGHERTLQVIVGRRPQLPIES